MRLWLCLVTVLVLLLCEYGDAKGNLLEWHILLPECPTGSVCLNFGTDVCTSNINGGNAKSSFVLLSDQRWKTLCKNNNYGFLLGRLNIQPINHTNWKVMATLPEWIYREDKSETFYKLADFAFDFGNSRLSFINKNLTQLSWNDYTSDHRMSTLGIIESENKGITHKYSAAKFIKLEFDLSANGRKMIDLIDNKVTMHMVKNTYEIDDADFPEEIGRLTNCDLSEIKSRLVCYDTCNEMLPKPNSTDSSNSTNSTDSSISTEWLYTKVPPSCPSLLWFHDTSEAGMMRHWRKVDTLECHLGYWQGEWTQHEEGKPAKGIRKFNSTEELQCSSVHPEKLTPQGKIVAGVAGGIGGLLFIGLMALLVLCLVRKRRRRRNAKKFQFGADTTVGSCSTVGLPGKSTEREGTLRDSGTQREEEPTKRAWWSPKKKTSSPRVDSSPLKVDSSPAKYENYTPPGTGTHAA